MRRFVLLLLLAGAPARAEIAHPAFDHLLLAEVAAAALAFMAPRTLEPVPIPQLAAWGLHGLTALDPRLLTDLRSEPDGTATLSLRLAPLLARAAPARPPATPTVSTQTVPTPTVLIRAVLTRPAPAAADAAGWGEAVAQIAQAAVEVSEPVRRAGTQGLIRSFFDELFNHLDPYSRYAPPGEAEADQRRRAGSAGVGLTASPRGGIYVVTAIQAGGAAAQAGVRVGDRLLEVDGQPIRSSEGPPLAERLSGPESSSVEVTLRGADGRLRTTALERIRIPPETVTARRSGDLLVLVITGFSRSTGSRLAQELIRGLGDAAQPAPVRGVVLDLRGNRGGVLNQAVAGAAMLQASGVVAVTTGRAPAANHVFLADGRDLARGLPVVVLIDGDSASAAEIMAASLADQRRAVVVGSASLGKGLVQTITGLPDGGELLVTWSRVLAPLGWPLQGLGVLPQVCTSLGPDPLARQLAALARRTQPMQSALARHRRARAPVPAGEVLEIRAACPAATAADPETDLAAARSLIANPDAYAAALLTPPAGAPDLTQAPRVSN